MQKGEYHIVVTGIILNSKNEILISKRATNKKFGGMWECYGGSILAGETSKEGILRELKEELGVIFKPEEAIFLKEVKRERIPQNFKDLWLFKKDINIEDLTFLDGEATAAKWVSIDEFIKMFNNNEINQIKRSESRKYFEDVLQSYYSKNYRAAILLLYNVTIDDLYNKLLLMNERKYFNLSQELKKIDELSKNDSKYSEVVAEIYKKYKDKNILIHDTMDALEFFKKVRNKCAHPSFFKGENYSPYPEEVYMIMKRVYQDILGIEVFIKDPYELVKDDIESKEWGNITDIIMGFKKHEENYAIFSQYYTKK